MPVFLLMGGVHGEEMNGVEIVRRILRNGLNKPDHGTMIGVPVFNIFGFINLDRKFPDGRDLHRGEALFHVSVELEEEA